MITFSSIWRIIRRIAIGSAGILVVALITGAIYQAASTRLDESKFPAPGQLVDVGGRSLHLNCTGEGSPTVILESGLGGGSLDWSLVQPDTAKFARVCSYDRAGIAWSSPVGGTRNAARITDELHQLLVSAHISSPYVMVGHSIGGVYVQMFAARYPDEVAGVVLVDSSHPDQLSSIPGIPVFVPYVFKSAAPFGIARLVNKLTDAPPELPAELIAERAAMYSHTSSVYANANEMAAIPESMADLRRSPMQLDRKPLIVLMRGLNEGTSPETDAAWLGLQTDLAMRSSIGNLVIAVHSGHYVHFTEPDLVVDAIREVSRAVVDYK